MENSRTSEGFVKSLNNISDNIIVVAGTRPEITKLSPLINAIDAKVLLTGQHYSKDMRESFLKLLNTKKIEKLDLEGFEDFSKNRYKIIDKLTKNLKKRSEKLVIVLGDTNTTLVGALAAKASNKQLLFLESGMRSFELTQIEEYNRLIVSHIADFNFCNHSSNVENLVKEGISEKKIFLTGSTVYSSLKLIESKKNIDDEDYVLLTLHRPENVDNDKRLNELVKSLQELNTKIIFPIHPRTKQKLKSFDPENSKNIEFTEPQDYKTFISLISQSKFVISDSGGLQEECMILRKPLLIPREYSERREMLNVFNILTPSVEEVLSESKKLENYSSSLLKSVESRDYLYGKDEVVDNMIQIIKKL